MRVNIDTVVLSRVAPSGLDYAYQMIDISSLSKEVCVFALQPVSGEDVVFASNGDACRAGIVIRIRRTRGRLVNRRGV